jgi:hypothetical protein
MKGFSGFKQNDKFSIKPSKSMDPKFTIDSADAIRETGDEMNPSKRDKRSTKEKFDALVKSHGDKKAPIKQRENVRVESTDTHEVSSKKRGGKEKTKSDFKSDTKSTDVDTGTTYSTSTRDKQSTNRQGKSKSTNKQTFKETDASGKTLTKSKSKTKGGVTKERGFTTDESGKKQRYKGEYSA